MENYFKVKPFTKFNIASTTKSKHKRPKKYFKLNPYYFNDEAVLINSKGECSLEVMIDLVNNNLKMEELDD